MKKMALLPVALMLSIAAHPVRGQAGDATSLLLAKLHEQFVPTKFSADNSQIVTEGATVALKKEGMLFYPANLRAAPVSVLKKDRLAQSFLELVAVGAMDGPGYPGGAAAIPTKKLVAGEKVRVRAIEFGKDCIMVEVVTDPYDDGRYFGIIKLPLPKGSVPTPEDGVRMISEVLELQANQQATPTDASSASQPVGLSGKYDLQGQNAQLVFVSNSTVLLIAPGRPQTRYQYLARGDSLTMTSSATGHVLNYKVLPDRLISLDGGAVWLRIGGAPASSAEVASLQSSTPDPHAPPKYEDFTPPPPPPPAPTITLGELKEQVIADFGEPQQKSAGPKEVFIYRDLKMKVTFTKGKVSSFE